MAAPLTVQLGSQVIQASPAAPLGTPVSSAPASAAASFTAGGLGGYQSAYQAALAQNQQLYQNVLAGYRDTAAQQRREQTPLTQGYADLQKTIDDRYGSLSHDYGVRAGWAHDALARGTENIMAGYDRLNAAVMGDINSVGGAQRQSIADQYARAGGQAAQQLVTAGLGNTTVRSAVQRGLTLDEAKAYTDLADRLAQLRAAHAEATRLPQLAFWERATSGTADLLNRQAEFRAGLDQSAASAYGQYGLAGLGYQAGALQDRTGLEQAYLGYAGSPTIGYPDPAPYMQQAQMLYQAQQDQLARQEAQKAAELAIALGLRSPTPTGGGVGMGSGYMPSAGPSAVPGGVNPLGGAGGPMVSYPGFGNQTAAQFYSNVMGYGRGPGGGYTPVYRGGPPAGYAAATQKVGPAPGEEVASYLGNPYL